MLFFSKPKQEHTWHRVQACIFTRGSASCELVCTGCSGKIKASIKINECVSPLHNWKRESRYLGRPRNCSTAAQAATICSNCRTRLAVWSLSCCCKNATPTVAMTVKFTMSGVCIYGMRQMETRVSSAECLNSDSGETKFQLKRVGVQRGGTKFVTLS